MKKYYDLDLLAEQIDERLAQVPTNTTNINNNTLAIENLQDDINIDNIVAHLDELINLWDDNEN